MVISLIATAILTTEEDTNPYINNETSDLITSNDEKSNRSIYPIKLIISDNKTNIEFGDIDGVRDKGFLNDKSINDPDDTLNEVVRLSSEMFYQEVPPLFFPNFFSSNFEYSKLRRKK
jgi:hypothetical protein